MGSTEISDRRAAATEVDGDETSGMASIDTAGVTRGDVPAAAGDAGLGLEGDGRGPFEKKGGGEVVSMDIRARALELVGEGREVVVKALGNRDAARGDEGCGESVDWPELCRDPGNPCPLN